jgi:hypothetical protein
MRKLTEGSRPTGPRVDQVTYGNSAVRIATLYGLHDRGVGVRVPVGLVFFLHRVQTGSGHTQTPI